MIGVMPQQKLNLITTRLSFPGALRESVRQNAKGALLIAQFLKGMAERRMSPKSLTGPIGIAQLRRSILLEVARTLSQPAPTLSFYLALGEMFSPATTRIRQVVSVITSAR